MTKKLIAFLQDNAAYISHIIPLAVAHDGTEATGLVTDWLDESTADEINEPFGLNVAYAHDDDGDSASRRQRILGVMAERRLDGFLVFLQIPVREYNPSGKSWRSSLGHYREHVLYTHTLDGPEFINRIQRLVNDSIEHDKRESTQAAPAGEPDHEQNLDACAREAGEKTDDEA